MIFLRWGGLREWVGKAFLNMMLWMVFSSVLYSSSCRLYVFNLLYRNLMAAYLCWDGWLEECGMIVSVKVGFLFIEVFQPVGVLLMVMSK